jgi:hypothetical protein
MCEVVGQVLSIRTVSVTSIPVTVSSSKITSGTWQEALTIVSKPVRATATRNPAVLSCASRTSRDTPSPSAINTSGAAPRVSACGVAATGGVEGVVRERWVPFRCTPQARSKNVAEFALRDWRLAACDSRWCSRFRRSRISDSMMRIGGVSFQFPASGFQRLNQTAKREAGSSEPEANK